LLTGAALFDPKGDPVGRFAVDDQHLCRMIQLRGQPFPPEMLKKSRKAAAFFEPNGSKQQNNIRNAPTDACL
jgi:serine/threonine-protein kinase SRPK3